MQEAGIILSPILPVPKNGGGGGVIHVSRNIMSIVSMLNSVQINVLMVIVEALRPYLIYGREYVWSGPGEIEIPIPISVISNHHTYSTVIEWLEPLTQIPVRYIYSIPGVISHCSGTTSIVSTFEHRNRQYYARIPSASLPFYLFCGFGVGYVQPIRNLVLSMTGKYEKRLYIGLLHYMDHTTKVAKAVLSISELRELLGFDSDEVLARIQDKGLDRLRDFLNTNNAPFEMTYSLTDPTRRGRPSYSKIEIVMRPRPRTALPSSASSATHEAVISTISRYHTYWVKMGDVKPTPEIADAIIGMDKGEELLGKVTNAEEAEAKNNRPKKAPFILANIVAKILREDYDIEVFVFFYSKKSKNVSSINSHIAGIRAEFYPL